MRGFLTIGLFDPDDSGAGHQTTLEIIELGERLGPALGWTPAALPGAAPED